MTDLDAITFCGSWDANDCAFTNEGQPPEWACGFHRLVAEVRRLREAQQFDADIVTANEELGAALIAIRHDHEQANARIVQQRDEARAEVERLRGKIVLFANDCVDLTRARDEARAEVDHVRALLNAKRAWIDGAKVDLDGYDEARAAIARARALAAQWRHEDELFYAAQSLEAALGAPE